jgi:predicted permease
VITRSHVVTAYLQTMATFQQDLRFAFRSLRKAPAFTIAAVATLALGIGASTAIFSTVNAVLLRPLPYPNPENLYGLRTALTDGRVTTGMLAQSEIIPLNSADLPIERAAGLQQINATLIQRDGLPRQTSVYPVTEGFFELFGLPMTLGGFTKEQFNTNGPPVVVISHRIWTAMFDSDPNIVGKPIRFAELATTIAGVAPKQFDTPHNADFWFSFQSNPNDVNHSFDGFVRLKPGADYNQTLAGMELVMRGVERQLPSSAKARVYVVRSLVESIVGDLGPILIVVLSATGLLLLLACVNVTNLMLARGAARAREMAVRVALGAGRGRIVRQLLTESIVLATAGAAAGLLIAYVGVKALQSVGAAKLPRLDTIPFDVRVLLFALATLLVTGLLVGLAPAFRLARTEVRTLMNEGGRSASAGRGTGRWLTAMTMAEIALAVTLVAGAGWLIRSFSNLQAIDPGFVADERMIFDFTPRGPRFADAPTATATLTAVIDELRGIAGISHVGATSSFPLRGTQENSLFAEIAGIPADPNRPLGTRQRIVTPGFFQAAGVELVAGRDFTPEDRADTRRVVIVNKTFAERYLKGITAIGTRFSFGYPAVNPNTASEIVGVVEDVRQRTLVDPVEPAFYSPVAQGFPFRLAIVVHATRSAVASIQAAIRSEMRSFDPEMAVDFQPVSEIVSSTIKRQELGMTLMLVFGVVAVVLAAVGIYGVVAYAATERRHEVATRLALGASPMNVFSLVLRQGVTLAVIGTAIGLGFAYVAGLLISKSLYAITASDPLILSGAVLIVVVIAALATTIPAWRASRLNPAHALHTE